MTKTLIKTPDQWETFIVESKWGYESPTHYPVMVVTHDSIKEFYGPVVDIEFVYLEDFNY